MANNRVTKEAFKTALKEMLVERSLAKISVKDIAEYCELSRNSFYYHFTDKYELVNWIFYSDMIKNVNTFHDPSKLTESFVNVCKFISQEREFYLSCFQYTGQNSLYETLYGLYFELWKLNLDMRYMESHIKLSEDELELMADFNAHAMVGIISDWVKKGMRNNYMEYFERVRKLLDMEYFSLPIKPDVLNAVNRIMKMSEEIA